MATRFSTGKFSGRSNKAPILPGIFRRLLQFSLPATYRNDLRCINVVAFIIQLLPVDLFEHRTILGHCKLKN